MATVYSFLTSNNWTKHTHNSKTGRAYTESTFYMSTEVLNVSAFLSH